MDPIYVILIVVGIVAVLFLGIYILIPIAMKKGLNITKTLETTDTVLTTVGAAIDGVQVLIPDSKALDVVEKIIEYAKRAAEAAEQMYKAAQIKSEERNPTAINLVYDCLSIAGIEPFPIK